MWIWIAMRGANTYRLAGERIQASVKKKKQFLRLRKYRTLCVASPIKRKHLKYIRLFLFNGSRCLIHQLLRVNLIFDGVDGHSLTLLHISRLVTVLLCIWIAWIPPLPLPLLFMFLLLCRANVIITLNKMVETVTPSTIRQYICISKIMIKMEPMLYPWHILPFCLIKHKWVPPADRSLTFRIN